MNKTQRSKISAAISTLEQMREDLSSIAESEREALDNASERVQESDKWQARDSRCDELESGMQSLDEIIDSFNNAIEEE